MIDIGMPTLIETADLESCAALCHELDLQFIELNMNLPQYQTENFDIPFFNMIAAKYGIYYTIHLDENLNISDFNPYVASAYINTVTETIQNAKALNIPALNMHLSKGVYFTLPDKKVFLFNEYKEKYLRSITAFRDECEKVIGGGDIKINVENSGGYSDFQIEALDILLQSPVFGLTFDIGHNHSIGGVDEKVILERGDKLFHMHIHDALDKSNHLPLGTGELDLIRYFNLAKKHNCRVVLETKTISGLKESVNWVKQKAILTNIEK